MKDFNTKAQCDMVGTEDDGLYIYITVEINNKQFNQQYVANWNQDCTHESEHSDYIDDEDIINECLSLANEIAKKFFLIHKSQKELDELLDIKFFDSE